MDEVTDFLTCKEEEPSENENNDESEAAHDIITKEELLPEDDRLDPSCNLNEIKLENDNWEERMCEMTSVVITEANHIKFEIEGENVKDVSSKTPKARHRPGPRSRKRKLSESSENDGIMSSLSGITRRSSRRTVTTSRPLGGHLPQTFRDTEVSLPDNLLYCDDCASVYDGDCPEHGPLNIIEDVEVPIDLSDQSRASRTGPPLVRIGDSNIPGAGCGVRAAETIPARTRFGPYEGVIIPIDECTSYSWLIRKDGLPDHCLDGTEPGLSNWMRFVNCSRQESERNLVAFQYLGKVYYRTSCQIEPNEELLVWCGREYGRQLGIPSEAATVNSVKENYKCPACPSAFFNSLYLQRHTLRCRYLQGQSTGTLHVDLNENNDEWGGMLPPEDSERSVIEVLMAATKSSGYQGSFVCVQCDEAFTHSETLSSHLLTHAGENPLVCCVCNERFFDNETLKIHLKFHTGGKSFVCVDCNQMFSKKTFFLHLQEHSLSKNKPNSRPDSPPSPPREEKQQNNTVKKRKRRKTKNNDKRTSYTCTTCRKRFATLKQLSFHSRTHFSKTNQYECRTCHARFKSETLLRAHLPKHKDSYRYACTYCNIQLQEDSLVRNLVNSCNKCVRRCRNESTSETKPVGFSCLDCKIVCQKLVDFKKHLRGPKHQKIHSSKFTLSCTECEERFLSRSLLNKHLETHAVEEKRFVCARCGVCFFYKPSLDRHLKTLCRISPRCLECCMRLSEHSWLVYHFHSYAAKAK